MTTFTSPGPSHKHKQISFGLCEAWQEEQTQPSGFLGDPWNGTSYASIGMLGERHYGKKDSSQRKREKYNSLQKGVGSNTSANACFYAY